MSELDSDPKAKDQQPPAEKEVVTDRSAEDYARRLMEVSDENKKFRQKAAEYRKKVEEYEKKLNEVETKKKEEQGQYKELAESYRKEAEEKSKKLETMQQSYGYKVVTAQIKAEAAKMGCVDAEALIHLAPLGTLEVDEEFNVKQDNLKALLDAEVKKRPYLFKKEAPKITDGTPVGGPEQPTLKGLSTTQLAKLLAQTIHKPNQ